MRSFDHKPLPFLDYKVTFFNDNQSAVGILVQSHAWQNVIFLMTFKQNVTIMHASKYNYFIYMLKANNRHLKSNQFGNFVKYYNTSFAQNNFANQLNHLSDYHLLLIDNFNSCAILP